MTCNDCDYPYCGGCPYNEQENQENDEGPDPDFERDVQNGL